MRQSIRIGLVQPTITMDNQVNFHHIKEIVKNLMVKNPDVVIFPERWVYADLSNISKELVIDIYQKQLNFCTALTREFSIPLVTGALWKYQEQDDNFQSITYYINNRGKILSEQPKIQLYGLERKYLTPGNYLQLISDTSLDLKFTMLICFDVNISNHLSRLAALHGAEILFNPVLIMDSGLVNWDYYIHTRALENRIPIVACNSIGNFPTHNYSGNSKVISFKPGSASPVTLVTQSIPNSKNGDVFEVNLQFPNAIRKYRLSENHNFNKITIKESIV